MYMYNIEKLIEVKAAKDNLTKREVIHKLIADLDCDRRTLWCVRKASRKRPYNMQLAWALKLKKFFGLQKLDDLIDPAAERAIIKAYRNKAGG